MVKRAVYLNQFYIGVHAMARAHAIYIIIAAANVNAHSNLLYYIHLDETSYLTSNLIWYPV